MKLFAKSNTALHTAIQSNALFTDISGLIILLAAKPLAVLMGIPAPSYLVVTGVGLMIWAVVLFLRTQQPEISKEFAYLVIAGDILWVLGTDLLLFLPASPLTITGKWIAGIASFFVFDFAVWQYITLRKQIKATLAAA